MYSLNLSMNAGLACRILALQRADQDVRVAIVAQQEGSAVTPPGHANAQALHDDIDDRRAGDPHANDPCHMDGRFWQYVKAICGGESFTALTEGVQFPVKATRAVD